MNKAINDEFDIDNFLSEINKGYIDNDMKLKNLKQVHINHKESGYKLNSNMSITNHTSIKSSIKSKILKPDSDTENTNQLSSTPIFKSSGIISNSVSRKLSLPANIKVTNLFNKKYNSITSKISSGLKKTFFQGSENIFLYFL